MIEISLSKDKVRSTCTAEECNGLLMVVFDLSLSPGVAGLSPSRSTAHKALCCVLSKTLYHLHNCAGSTRETSR